MTEYFGDEYFGDSSDLTVQWVHQSDIAAKVILSCYLPRVIADDDTTVALTLLAQLVSLQRNASVRFLRSAYNLQSFGEMYR